MLYLADTAEMPVWTDETDAPPATYLWGTYTELGPFQPSWSNNRFVPVAQRIAHQPRHNPKLRWGQIRKWAQEVWREAGEFLFGAFQPIKDAI
jgi:hypothetical protein